MDKGIKTFTKKWVSIILFISLIDLQFSYILAWFDKVVIAETLSITIVTEIVGVMLVYCLKSFFETREAEKIRIKEQELGLKDEKEETEDTDV